MTRATGAPITHGNLVTPLQSGDEAYPVMLDAIERAERSLALCTYIFDNDRPGRGFVDAQARAVRRDVEVRVSIDGAGSRYSRPPVPRLLRAAGVPVAGFLESLLPVRNPYLNMRNHRKILVADGRTGFTLGLNLREGCVVALEPEPPVQDMHFCFVGPVVRKFIDAWDSPFEQLKTHPRTVGAHGKVLRLTREKKLMPLMTAIGKMSYQYAKFLEENGVPQMAQPTSGS